MTTIAAALQNPWISIPVSLLVTVFAIAGICMFMAWLDRRDDAAVDQEFGIEDDNGR